jgi:hypothetical protein
MKKIIIIFVLQLISLQVNSATLVFNQVLTFSGSCLANQNLTICTVPQGKTWKVESFTTTGSIFTLFNGLRSNSFNSAGTSISFWMKANDSLGVEPSYYPGNYSISIIEYNIVP